MKERRSSKALLRTLLIFVLAMGLTFLFVTPGLAAPGNPSGGGAQADVPRDSASSPQPGDETDVPAILREKQASADAVARELERLGTELEIAAEAYNKAKEELAKTDEALVIAREELRKATDDYRQRQSVYSARLNSIYRSGGGELDFLEVLLKTANFSDFLSRLNYIMQINYADSVLVRLLESDKETVDKRAAALEALKTQQLEVERRLQTEQNKLQQGIAQREQILAGLEADIRKILLADEAKKSKAQQAFLANLKLRAASLPSSQLRAMLDPSSVVATALQYLGVKYVWGGENPKIGLDCSGLVLVVFRQHGVKVRHYSGWQYGDAPMKVAKKDLQPGDLVFYGDPIHHVGIYIGDGYYIHAPRTGDVVKISSIERPDWAGAVRYPLRNRE